MVVRVKRHDTDKYHSFLSLLSLQFKNHASYTLYYHPFQYPISISSSHNLQCLRTFHLFLDTAANGDGVTVELRRCHSSCTAMTMLACARRRVQSVLPRPFAFSTTVPKQDAGTPTRSEDTMKDLSNMLTIAGDGVSPIIPGLSHNESA